MPAKTNDWVVHVEIGLAALEAGYLAADELARVVREVYGNPAAPTVDEVWIHSRRLSRDQLDTVLRASQFNPDTERHDSALVDGRTVRVSGTLGAHGPLNAKLDRSPDAGDRYLRIRNLGRGGMGEVTECLDNRLGRKVAVKTVRMDLQEDPETRVMLEREARVTGNLEHPGIVPVHDLGHHPTLGSFYVMRRLDMPTLAAILSPMKKSHEATGEFTLGRLLRLFIQICEVADYAHHHGVIHCDLKPANVLIGSYGEVMVLDWGLAFRKDRGTGYRGGTPGYMAPEQASETGNVDERTDVYALGIVLYEILALASPYEVAEVMTYDFDGGRIPCAPDKPPRRPSERARPGRVPPELDDVCLKALELSPADRFPSAKALASAIEAFLEGTAERERRQRRADDLVVQGGVLAASYHDFLASRPDRVDELDEVRSAIPPWESVTAKQPLWEAEDRLEVMDALGVRMLHSAVATYEQALDEVPTHPAARLGLARLYLAEYRRAVDRRDDVSRVYFEQLIHQYDDGSVHRVMTADGFISIHSNPSSRVTLARFEQHARRLVPRPAELDTTTPIDRLRVLPGSYLATLESPHGSVRYPIHVRSEQELTFAVDLTPVRELPAGEIYVPGGLTKIGGDEDGRDLRTVDVPSFVIGQYPVTFAEYMEFVTDLAKRDPTTATRHIPKSASAEPYWRWSASEACFEPTSADTLRYNQKQFLALPAFGIDAHSAMAYLGWKSERTGRPYRLPTELEWERAGRGADGRLFPWGERFDASFCKMRESTPGVPKPERSGRFEHDVSPFGVCDLAGGVAEWVVPLERNDLMSSSSSTRMRMMTRGGAWCDFADDCQLSARRIYLAVEFSARIGFRIARGI